MGSAVMQRKLNDARTLALSLGDQPAVLATYVSGSLTAGLGNTTSDADVFAVVGDEADLPASPPQYLAESGRIDVEYVRTGDLRACVERLGRFRVERESFTAARLPEDELDLLARFHYRLDAAPGPELAELAARLSGLQSRLRQALISHWSRVVSDALEDLRGALLDDDPDTAVVVGQKLLLGAAKALAAGCGDYYVGAKWAFRQVRRSAPGFPLDRLRLAQRGGWADTAAPAASAGDGAIRLAQAMLAAAELLGWDEPLADRWPWPEPATRSCPSRWSCRSPAQRPSPTSSARSPRGSSSTRTAGEVAHRHGSRAWGGVPGARGGRSAARPGPAALRRPPCGLLREPPAAPRAPHVGRGAGADRRGQHRVRRHPRLAGRAHEAAGGAGRRLAEAVPGARPGGRPERRAGSRGTARREPGVDRRRRAPVPPRDAGAVGLGRRPGGGRHGPGGRPGPGGGSRPCRGPPRRGRAAARRPAPGPAGGADPRLPQPRPLRD